jgi:acetyl-CoA C-acetyltransferase
MGVLTERLIAAEGVTRAEMDAVAAASNQRAAAAQESGAFRDEIVPISYREKRQVLELAADEGVRADTTVETLAGLKPAFDRDGSLTAGNSSQISDGAAGLVLASADAVEKYGLKPIAKITGSAITGTEPWRFPEAPVPAVRKLLQKMNRTVEDIDLFENNEAFAVNSVLFHKMLGVPHEKLNVHGGAIALGHPIGCSGARIVVTLIHALATHDKNSGVAAICHGTGGGTALGIDRA